MVPVDDVTEEYPNNLLSYSIRAWLRGNGGVVAVPLVAVIVAGAVIAAADCGVFAVGAAMDTPETDDKTEG